MNKKILALLLVVVIAVAAVSVYVLFSQQPSDAAGALTVRWENINGVKISGVTLTILGPQETMKTGVTDQNGEVTFTGLPAGNYEGIATKDGYQVVFISAIVNNAKTTTLNSGINQEQPSQIQVSVNPKAAIIGQGDTAKIAVSLISTDNSAGTVTLGYTDAEGTGTLPSGVTATFDPSSVTLTADGEASSSLTLSASSTAPKGIYKIGITISDQYSPLGYGWLLLQVS
jgi:hypothetical protein